MPLIDSIVEIIRNSNSVLITTHEGPDGDALGSSLALASFLEKIGKEVHLHFQDNVPELYSFLPLADKVSAVIPEQDFDLAFVLDIGEKRRAGKIFCDFKRIGKTINLDHHLTCENFGDINLIDPKAAATGVIVHRVISRYGYQFDLDTALAIYVSVITDTGSFRYSNANKEAFHVAGDMIEAGVNAWDVAEKLYENQPRKRLELLSEALPTIDFFAGGKAASITVTTEMYKKSGANAELTDGFVNYPRSVNGVEVAVFFRQIDNSRVKVGFRSKGKVNVAQFSAAFGGGGHHNAAGCSIDGTIDEVRQKIYRVVEAAF